jgi:hypothetical protein
MTWRDETSTWFVPTVYDRSQRVRTGAHPKRHDSGAVRSRSGGGTNVNTGYGECLHFSSSIRSSGLPRAVANTTSARAIWTLRRRVIGARNVSSMHALSIHRLAKSSWTLSRSSWGKLWPQGLRLPKPAISAARPSRAASPRRDREGRRPTRCRARRHNPRRPRRAAPRVTRRWTRPRSKSVRDDGRLGCGCPRRR